ncbi:unnamed protein product, partial [Rotaria sp. Silwood1]
SKPAKLDSTQIPSDERVSRIDITIVRTTDDESPKGVVLDIRACTEVGTGTQPFPIYELHSTNHIFSTTLETTTTIPQFTIQSQKPGTSATSETLQTAQTPLTEKHVPTQQTTNTAGTTQTPQNTSTAATLGTGMTIETSQTIGTAQTTTAPGTSGISETTQTG